MLKIKRLQNKNLNQNSNQRSRKKFGAILSLMMLVVMSGCKASENGGESDFSADQISEQFKTNIVFKDDLQKIDDESLLKNLYPQIDLDYISDYSVYISASGATAEEIAVFKLKDKIYGDDIQKLIEDRIEKQKSNFENYVPEEIYKLNNSIADYNEEQKLAIYVSCDTPDDVEFLLKKLYTK